MMVGGSKRNERRMKSKINWRWKRRTCSKCHWRWHCSSISKVPFPSHPRTHLQLFPPLQQALHSNKTKNLIILLEPVPPPAARGWREQATKIILLKECFLKFQQEECQEQLGLRCNPHMFRKFGENQPLQQGCCCR